MDWWISNHNGSCYENTVLPGQVICGTSACAVGWLIQLMPELGLYYCEEQIGLLGTTLDGEKAIAAAFDLDSDWVDFIFYREAYSDFVTARDVARRIRKVVGNENSN